MAEIINLLQKHCVPCEGGMPPLNREQIEKYSKETPDWEVVDDKKIVKKFAFKDFKEAMVFVNKVAEIAESEGHHPDIYIYYNELRFELTTHAMKGLSENDFILAAKINAIH